LLTVLQLEQHGEGALELPVEAHVVRLQPGGAMGIKTLAERLAAHRRPGGDLPPLFLVPALPLGLEEALEIGGLRPRATRCSW
jgi:hypothetical protein